MDLLRACQKEGLVRIERDRRGGLRVFQGQALPKLASAQVYEGLPRDVEETEAAESVDVVDVTPIESQPGEAMEPQPPVEPEEHEPEIEAIPIDTTAELLGRAKPKRPAAGRGRARAPRSDAAPRAARAPKAKKPSTRRAPRAKKAAGGEVDGNQS
jgi:hypothetical protein